MRMHRTTLTRISCIVTYGGYTEIENRNGSGYDAERYVLIDPVDSSTSIFKTGILFSYELDSQGASTGLRYDYVLQDIEKHFVGTYAARTDGAYKTKDGVLMEEAGMFLRFSRKISPVEIGVIAHSIAVMFRQESVLVFSNYEAEFVYA